MEQDVISMEIINPKAAGIDVGSRSHWAAVGQSEQDIKEYGVFNEDLFALADWFDLHGIKTIAMESTGTYWQSLYAVLLSRGFHVILCNGKFTKNIKGKKMDPKTAQSRTVIGKLSARRGDRTVKDILQAQVEPDPLQCLHFQKDAKVPAPFEPAP